MTELRAPLPTSATANSASVPQSKDLRERALVVDLDGLIIRVAGRDDLIRMKRAAGRPQDLDDIAALTALDGTQRSH